MNPTSVSERINLHFSGLSTAEKRAARALTSNYPAAGLDTVKGLALRAGVSTATVVRFVQSLEFDGYREFQEALRTEVAERSESALVQAHRTVTVSDGTRAPLEVSEQAFTEGIAATFAALRASEVEEFVTVLADPDVRIIAHGGLFSQILARHLVAQLTMFRGNVSVAPEDSLGLADILTRDGDAVWVIFDFRRYSPATLDLAVRARDRGARIALVTDRWLSPIAEKADIVLSARVEAAGPSDTLVPALALVEALCEHAVEKLGEDGLNRLETVDALRRDIAHIDRTDPIASE